MRYRKYVEKLRVDINRLFEVAEMVRKDEIVITAGKGRSGKAAELGAMMLRKIGVNSFYYEDASAPLAEEVGEKKTLGILVSGSGKTPEIVKLAKELQKLGGEIVAFTSSPNSPLAEYANIVLELPSRARELSGSYLERRVVRTEMPTMGDLPEEASIYAFYNLSKVLNNEEVEKIGKFSEWIENNTKNIEKLSSLLKTYSDTGILVIAKGMSRPIAGMIVNRANHYAIKMRSVDEPSSSPLRPTELAIIISGSADPFYRQLVGKIKELKTEIGRREIRACTVAIVGREAPWLRETDFYVVIGGEEEPAYSMFRERGSVSWFYFMAPVFINTCLRNVAEKIGITEVYASYRHINV